ncbi:MAG: hypothetical protein ACKESB_02985 [Candidatus Hodgkinia cicadicola]
MGFSSEYRPLRNPHFGNCLRSIGGCGSWSPKLCDVPLTCTH